MNVLVTGAKGMVGQALDKACFILAVIDERACSGRSIPPLK